MERLNNEELKNVNGGFLRILLGKKAIIVGGAISFIIGLINGLFRLK